MESRGSYLNLWILFLKVKLKENIHPAEELANNFADYFENKIANIRLEVASKAVAHTNYVPDSSLYQSEVKFHQFSPVTETGMKGLTGKIACKSCLLDSVL